MSSLCEMLLKSQCHITGSFTVSLIHMYAFFLSLYGGTKEAKREPLSQYAINSDGTKGS